ncbi:MAG TPA: formylglycine-generating enzyme family protein [Steroidobacter sp.]|uniref:formylglycine-generating enzyme family protein n=1 Tax=Steroidobacter sp. TaxID=1978227 RepID=UPI002ED95025
MRRILIVLALVSIAAAGISYLWPAASSMPTPPASTQSFRDCDACPEMIVIPAGSFVMGAEPTWWERDLTLDAQPRRTVTITRPFAAGKFEVTHDQWNECVRNGGCNGYQPDDAGFGRGERPVLNVSWQDVQAYVQWLSARTGASYRLLTEAEWEYAARAGTDTRYPWGKRASHDYANYGRRKCCTGATAKRDQWENTAPGGQFPPNSFGLHDMHGNVYEWVEDCYEPSYANAPVDGSAVRKADCKRHGIRGGAWYSNPGRVTSAYRAYQTPDKRDRVIGFRVAKTL